MIKEVDTIIIGGGIAGLACADRLHSAKRCFKLISSQIGGRIITPITSDVNYGAFFVTSEYKNVKKFVQIERQIRLSDLVFHRGKLAYSFWNVNLLWCLPQAIRFISLLYKFRQHYRKFKDASLRISQAEAIRSEPYLAKIYYQSTRDFINEHRLERLTKTYLHEMLYAMSFLPTYEGSAFGFLQWSSQLLLSRIYEFQLKKKELMSRFQKWIIKDEVVKIKRMRGVYYLNTKKGRMYCAKHVVIATQPWIAKKLLRLKRMNNTLSAHMFHLKGRLRPEWQKGREELFNPKSKTCVISKQRDGSYLIYTRTAYVDFGHFFEQYSIIGKKYWNPAFPCPGPILLDAEQGPNLYLAGDYNIGGLEDSCITGIYAANKIIESSRREQ